MTTRGALWQKVDPAVATAFGCIILLLLLGSLYSSSFLSPQYLLQQLKVASFLGVIATGIDARACMLWLRTLKATDSRGS